MYLRSILNCKKNSTSEAKKKKLQSQKTTEN